MTDLYAATSKHLLLRQYPSAISTVHALLNDLRSRHPFIYNRPERANSTTPALLLQWESYPYSTIQALKLLCTVYVSAWSGGVTATEVLRKTGGKRQEGPKDVKLQALTQALPPNSSSPNAILETTLALCLHTLGSTQPAHLNANKGTGPADQPTASILNLPPSLLLTFLLACIKISTSSDPSSRSSSAPTSQQEESAIPFARKLFEDWLAVFPDEALYALSQARPMRTPRRSGRQSLKAPLDASTSSLSASTSSVNSGNQSDTSPSASTVIVDAPSEDDQDRSMLLQFKKDYLRLVEVYVLEVLPRQDDWDIASDFVMGDFVMGAKRKEQMLKRLHEAKAKHTASATRARRSSANLSRGGPTSMTTMSSSAVEGEDLDNETVIAGLAAGRQPSRRSSDASTERTARPYDRGHRVGRGQASVRESGGVQDASRVTSSQPAETTASIPSRASAPIGGAPSNREDGPTSRAMSSFAALRNRIVEYLDEPLSEPRQVTDRPGPNDPSRRNRKQGAKGWSMLQLLRPKALAIIGAVLAALLARQQFRRRKHQQSIQSAGTIGSTIPLWYIINAQWWKDILVFVWQKLRTMFSMGTTLTYV